MGSITMEWLREKFELARGGTEHNVRAMEGLRGFAVFLVFLVHYATLIRPWIESGSALSRTTSAIHSIGNVGVDLFFVLSGYLIYGSLMARSTQFGTFMARRIQRIYPAFLAVFLLYVALSFLFPDQNKIPASAAAASIYLLQNLLLLPGLFPIEPMITVAWSLSYELFYYISIPIVVTVFRLREQGSSTRILLFILIAIASALFCAAYGGPVRLIMFIAGILLYEVEGVRSARRPRDSIGMLSLISGLAATLTPVSGSVGYTLKISLLFVSFFLLCRCCFGYPPGLLARAFSWTPLRWLGNMSYSYYLLHGLALKAAFLALAKVLPSTEHDLSLFSVMLPLMFATTLAPTALLFLFVERPFSLNTNRNRRHSEQVRDPLPQTFDEKDLRRVRCSVAQESNGLLPGERD